MKNTRACCIILMHSWNVHWNDMNADERNVALVLRRSLACWLDRWESGRGHGWTGESGRGHGFSSVLVGQAWVCGWGHGSFLAYWLDRWKCGRDCGLSLTCWLDRREWAGHVSSVLIGQVRVWAGLVSSAVVLNPQPVTNVNAACEMPTKILKINYSAYN